MPSNGSLCRNGLHPWEGENIVLRDGKPKCAACAQAHDLRANKRQVDSGYRNAAMRKFRMRLAGLIAQAKLDLGCASCGYAEHPDALEFDHIVPLHETGGVRHGPLINTMAGLERAIEDPNLQVLCANCHAIKSNAERRVRMTKTVNS